MVNHASDEDACPERPQRVEGLLHSYTLTLLHSYTLILLHFYTLMLYSGFRKDFCVL